MEQYVRKKIESSTQQYVRIKKESSPNRTELVFF